MYSEITILVKANDEVIFRDDRSKVYKDEKSGFYTA